MNANHIAFYAPLKSANHDVPSGDRLMARSLIQCLREFGYSVETVSELRARISDPQDDAATTRLLESAEQEIARITLQWQQSGPPACWFCYHPYYKSPDLIGPTLCKAFDIPYVTAEASYSHRRTDGFWRFSQARVVDAVNQACVNFYFTERDKRGLLEGAPEAALTKLAPFITPIKAKDKAQLVEPYRLQVVAMMRTGDKFDSYQQLANALSLIPELPWVLHVVGDGEMQSEVHALFAHFPNEKLVWHGKKSADDVATFYEEGYLYVWPGCGEAYGLAYLEAQSAGLPVVAYETAGVPEVVQHDHSGLLVEDGDVKAMANAIARLLTNKNEYLRLSKNAQQNVRKSHSFEKASDSLGQSIQQAIGRTL